MGRSGFSGRYFLYFNARIYDFINTIIRMSFTIVVSIEMVCLLKVFKISVRSLLTDFFWSIVELNWLVFRQKPGFLSSLPKMSKAMIALEDCRRWEEERRERGEGKYYLNPAH